ncbi:MAG: hypothetical protein GY859_25545, partial [Desulfobacterales bacterium]|nr:hypothetical protein [Desulfobacterales bacterium]
MDKLDIALHLRDLKEPSSLDFSQYNYLKNLYKASRRDAKAPTPAPSFNRIYVGDEFCSCRMPGLKELETFERFAAEKELPITLLTPPLTDEGLERICPLFEHLSNNHPDAEVVVNDWGALYYLKNHHPSLALSAGRLLNKGYKDPRLKQPEEPGQRAGETDALLSTGAFDHGPIQEKMAEFGVVRCERDLPPYQSAPANKTLPFKTSCYFPFGQVTSGRICWMAAFNQPPEKRYIPPRR